MGCGSGGGTNTVVQNSQPPQQFLDAYTSLIDQAQNVAGKPLQQYSGPTVAGFTPAQTNAFDTINASQGISYPYINAASGYIANSTAPLLNSNVPGFSAANVGQYESPYTSDVVNATQAEFDNQNAQAANQLKGNAAAQGALGGDREGVAQAVLKGQEDLAQAPTIAGLENQGYSQALGELNTQQQLGLGANEAQAWLNSQAGFGMGNLGQEAQSTTLSGAGAQLQAGALEQQLAQEQLNIPYEQFLQQQAYPFQTSSWLASLTEGLGAGAGGTGNSATTVPGASLASQLGGAAVTGLGLYGLGAEAGLWGGTAAAGAGAAGATAADAAAALAFAADGGRIRRDAGGGVPGFSAGQIPNVPDVSLSFIPRDGASASRAATLPAPGAFMPQQQDPTLQATRLMDAAGNLKSLMKKPAAPGHALSPADAAAVGGYGGFLSPGADTTAMENSDAALFHRGGRTGYDAGGGIGGFSPAALVAPTVPPPTSGGQTGPAMWRSAPDAQPAVNAPPSLIAGYNNGPGGIAVPQLGMSANAAPLSIAPASSYTAPSPAQVAAMGQAIPGTGRSFAPPAPATGAIGNSPDPTIMQALYDSYGGPSGGRPAPGTYTYGGQQYTVASDGGRIGRDMGGPVPSVAGFAPGALMTPMAARPPVPGVTSAPTLGAPAAPAMSSDPQMAAAVQKLMNPTGRGMSPGFADGGSPGSTEAYIGQEQSGGAPQGSTASFQQLQALPAEKLQEMAARMPPGSAYGQMVQRALQTKRMSPNQTEMRTAATAVQQAAPANPFAPTQAPAAGFGNGAGGLGVQTQPFRRGGFASGVVPGSRIVMRPGFASGGDPDDTSDTADGPPLVLDAPADAQSDIPPPPPEKPPVSGFGDASVAPAPVSGAPTSNWAAPQHFEARDYTAPKIAPQSGFADSKWLPLLVAGAAMMAGRSPYAGVNIGQGLTAGLKEYTGERTAQRAIAEKQATIDQDAQKLSELANYHADDLNAATRRNADAAEEAQDRNRIAQQTADTAAQRAKDEHSYQMGELAKGDSVYQGTTTDANGNAVGVYLDRRNNKTWTGPIVQSPKPIPDDYKGQTVKHWDYSLNGGAGGWYDTGVQTTVAQRAAATQENADTNRQRVGQKIDASGPTERVWTQDPTDPSKGSWTDTGQTTTAAQRLQFQRAQAQQDPARVKEANWLYAQGIAPDIASAYDMVRAGVNDGTQWQREVESAKKTLAGTPKGMAMAPDDLEAAAREVVISRSSAEPKRVAPIPRPSTAAPPAQSPPAPAVQRPAPNAAPAAARPSSSAAPPAAPAPTAGDIVNGYRFKGGNPNDQKNWEAAPQ